MSKAGPKPPIRSLLVHPVCFALLPVLVLYTGNLGDVHLGDLWLPAVLALAAGAAVWWVCTRVTRARPRGAVLASLFWLWFFAYGQWQRWLAPEDALAETVCPILYGVVLVVIVGLLVATRRDLKHPSGALNLIALVLVALQVLTIGRHEMKRLRYRPGPPAERVEARAAAAGEVRPHLYFIVLDGYARADVLADLYRYDNQPFLDFLHSRGFQIARDSRANYCQTQLSLGSCLNLDYLEALADPEHPRDRLRVPQLLAENRVFAFLREQGYAIVPFASGYYATEMPGVEVRRPPRRIGELSEFQTALVSATPLLLLLRSRLGRSLDADHVRGEMMLYTFSHLASVARSPRPSFIFAHLVCPHPPFIFRRDGSMVGPLKSVGLEDGVEFRGTQEEYVNGYREQVEFVNRRVETLVDEILVAAARPTAIVLISDHGPGSRLDWHHLDKVDLRERFATLVAIRLPEGKTAKLDDHISTVNVLRFVLSRCLGADLPPFPSRSYFSDWRDPLNLTLVTDEQGRFRRFAASPARKAR